MAILTLSAYVIENNLPAEIVKDLATHISRTIDNRLGIIRSRVSNAVMESFRQSPTWSAIAGGELEEYFKIPDGTAALSSLEDDIIATLQVTKVPIKASASSISGGLTVNILDDNIIGGLRSSNFAYYTINGVPISWMEWILSYGNRIIAPNAKLVKTSRGVVLAKSSENLQVPSAHAGTEANNFITRAFGSLEASIGLIIEEEISKG